MTGGPELGPGGDHAPIQEVLGKIALNRLCRVDVGLEGDWSGTVVPVWTRADGFLGFDGVSRSHAFHRPSLELYFDDGWIGLRCCRHEGGEHVFDEGLARAVLDWVEERA